MIVRRKYMDKNINIDVNTTQVIKSIEEMTNTIKIVLSEINTSISEVNTSGTTMGDVITTTTSIVNTATGAFSMFGKSGDFVENTLQNLTNIFSKLNDPIGIAMLAIAGIIGVVGLLAGALDDENVKHQAIMDAINKEIDARNELKNKQQEQLDSNLSEIGNVQSLNNELSNLVDANGQVKAGYEDRAAFIISVLNKALGEQIAIEDGVVKGYDKSSNSINDKIAKMKAEAILEAQLPAYKKALLEATNAQIEADKLESELSDLKIKKKAKEAELEAKYGDDWYKKALRNGDMMLSDWAMLENDTKKKEEEYNKQSELVSGYYEDMSNYETNAALIASGNAENYAKVQMDTVTAKVESVEGKKAALEEELEAENGHIEALKEQRQAATDEEVQQQLDAQIAAEEAKAAQYQAELDQMSEQKKKVLEQKQLDNEEDLLLLGEHIAGKQEKLTEMYATEEAEWTDEQKKKADSLKNAISEELTTYTNYASDKVGKAVELSSKLNENSTQEEKDAAAAATREALSTLQILGQNVEDKLAVVEDLKARKARGEKGITDDMIKEAERQAVEAEKGYGKVAEKVEKSWKDLPKSSQETFKNVMSPMLEEMEKKEPDLFKKAGGIAEGILGRLKKSFDINSPSRKVKKIFMSVMEGAEVGLEDKTPELMDQADEIAENVLDVFSKVNESDIRSMVQKMNAAMNMEQMHMQGIVNSNFAQEIKENRSIKVEIPKLIGTIKGEIENHILMDGRETAVQLSPFISEEVAFSSH